MGLSIDVGAFTDDDPEDFDEIRAELAGINDVLREQGFPTHDEPESLPELLSRADFDSFPYNWIHYLRRVTAEVLQDPDFRAEPLPEGERPADSEAIDREYDEARSHLICHSDYDGYYFPIALPRLVADATDAGRIPGVVLGSTQCLMADLVATAPALGITLDDGNLSDAEAERLNRLSVERDGLRIEIACWMTLFEAARLSLAHRAAVRFA